jgi:hypothetical protein
MFDTMADAVRFITAGKATVTLVSKKTGTRFTFKVQVPKDAPDAERASAPKFVKVLTGSDNETAYAFLGTLFPPNERFPKAAFRISQKARISPDAPSARAARWLFEAIAEGRDVTDVCEIWHEGKCGWCGKKLTVPSSIAAGYGPDCLGYVGLK